MALKSSRRLKEWSDEWQDAMEMTGDIERVIKLWSRPIPEHWRRARWKPEYGYRKIPKGGKDRGEQVIEKDLLAPKGEVSLRAISGYGPVGGAWFLGIYNDMRLASDFRTKKAPGQVIADAFGLLVVGKKARPICVEVKIKDKNSWYAVVENLRQVRLLRRNEKNLRKFLKGIGALGGLRLPSAKGAWGMVLAPAEFFEHDKKTGVWGHTRDLLLALRKTEARVCLASTADLQAYKSIRIIAGNWPSR